MDLRLWNADDFVPPSSPLIPVEVIRKIILLRLADAVWSLIVESDLENNWDPFLPLLHASSQFREITAEYLDHIVGEPQVDVFDRSKIPASTITYHAMQSVLVQLREIAVLVDPQTPVSHMAQICRRLSSLPDECRSPILWHARSIAGAKLHIRGLERHGSGLNSKFHGVMIAPMKVYVETAPRHVSDNLLRPIRTLFLAYEVLSLRISVLRALCIALWDIFDRCPNSSLQSTFLQSQEDSLEEKFQVVTEALKVLTPKDEEAPRAEIENPKWTACDPSMLLIPGCPPSKNVEPEAEIHISADALKAIKFHKALENFQHPPGRPDDIWLLQFCRRARETLVSYLPWSQRDEFRSHLAELIVPRSHF